MKIMRRHRAHRHAHSAPTEHLRAVIQPSFFFLNQRDGNIIKKTLSILLAVELFEIGLQIFKKPILQDSQL